MLDEAGRLDWRLMDTRKDSTDFSDRIRVLDQGEEGACTGFGLAATINYLNLGRHADAPVSPRMLYEMAKRQDRWPGENFDGSSLRGAMKLA